MHQIIDLVRPKKSFAQLELEVSLCKTLENIFQVLQKKLKHWRKHYEVIQVYQDLLQRETHCEEAKSFFKGCSSIL